MFDCDDTKILIDSLEDVPNFATEDEEDVRWQTHDFSERMVDEIVRRERQRQARGEPPGSPTDALIRQDLERHAKSTRGND